MVTGRLCHDFLSGSNLFAISVQMFLQFAGHQHDGSSSFVSSQLDGTSEASLLLNVTTAYVISAINRKSKRGNFKIEPEGIRLQG